MTNHTQSPATSRAVRAIRRTAFLTAFFASAAASQGALTVPSFFSDHMVVQRDMPVPVWGTASPGAAVHVKLGEATADAAADAAGKWRATLPAMQADDASHTLTVSEGNASGGDRVFSDVLIGEVWLCTGQSNMELPLSQTTGGAEAIAAATNPKIRLLFRRRGPSPEPWRVCSPATAGGFSGVGYYFGSKLQADLKVPIGLIDVSSGGSSTEAWMDPAKMWPDPELNEAVRLRLEMYHEQKIAYDKAMADWTTSSTAAAKTGTPAPRKPATPRRLYPETFERPGDCWARLVDLMPFAVRGALWYQGESNAHNVEMGAVESKLLPAMMSEWRKGWGEGDFPILIVQLPDYTDRGFTGWPLVRQAQLEALATTHTGLVVTTDVGLTNDIHPPNKKPVGERLALWALAKVYDKSGIVYTGPLLQSIVPFEKTLRVYFQRNGSAGLATRDGKAPDDFEVAGPDENFLPAQTRIDGDAVVAWNDSVPRPDRVRMGWRNSMQPNLMNKEGLPASPFRARIER